MSILLPKNTDEDAYKDLSEDAESDDEKCTCCFCVTGQPTTVDQPELKRALLDLEKGPEDHQEVVERPRLQRSSACIWFTNVVILAWFLINLFLTVRYFS
jgi:hypothetical protein